MPDNVRCKDCGFLGLRMIHSREIAEVEQEIRESHKFPDYYTGSDGPGGTGEYYVPLAICCMMEKQVSAESTGPMTERAERFFTVINKDRTCQSFMEWQNGFTPKEHREMLDRRMNLEFQERRENADREYQRGRDSDDREWRKDQESIASKRHFQQLLVMGGLVILAQIFAGWLSRDRSPATQPSSGAASVIEKEKTSSQNGPRLIAETSLAFAFKGLQVVSTEYRFAAFSPLLPDPSPCGSASLVKGEL